MISSSLDNATVNDNTAKKKTSALRYVFKWDPILTLLSGL